MKLAEETDSKRIEAVSLYRPKLAASSGASAAGKKKRFQVRLYHILFAAAYVYQVGWVVSTIGRPYREFLEKVDREGFKGKSVVCPCVESAPHTRPVLNCCLRHCLPSLTSAMCFDRSFRPAAVMEGTNKMRAELEHALSDINDPNRPADKMGWFDWMSMDIEEHAERKKREKEKSVLDSLPKSMRVPGRHAPSFMPTLLLGILVTLNALVVLMQHWSVAFNVWLNYKEVAAESVVIPEDMMEVDLDEDEEEGGDGGKASGGGRNAKGSKVAKSPGDIILKRAEESAIPSNLPTHARVSPAAGKDVLVPLLYLPTLGMTFEYHRRRYAYDADARVWIKIRCRTTMPTSFFTDWAGFTSDDQITASHIRYGRNVFDVKQPTFKEMYKAQLLSPFTVFQLFCVVLWMLDEYWQYSAFTLFMILTFEGTVVFSRLKSMSALRGMGNKARPVLVYRLGRWIEVDSFDLLPGDILSLTRHKPHFDKGDGSNQALKEKTAQAAAGKGKVEDESGDVVPADILLLRGTCVVNEASLTGESVPQMKEGLSDIVEGDDLAMKTKHKTHVLYAGTKMLQCKGIETVEAEEESSDEDESGTNGPSADVGAAMSEKLYGSIPKPPDGGCLCFVLRTGFSSAQGKLVRMIEGSQEKVKGHERETGLLLLMLFFFALASASYVLYHGMHDENRSQFELLLHCILIITSVIPPELPMQMALAVNNSLMTLMKMQVFCTEPYRVPIAGKLDCCLYDKTGTLTTDELVAVGVLEARSMKEDGSADEDQLTAMTKVASESALVLAGCHSLVLVDGETTGDPLESAALNAMRWSLAKGTENVVPSPATEKKEEGKKIHASNATVSELDVLARHHFSSKLQRMSCVVRDVTNRRTFSVAKGSPEAIGNLLAQKPNGYDATAKTLAKKGYRVIALAYKLLGDSNQVEQAKDARAQCEENLIFAGYIAFTCRVRRDTKAVLQKLKQGGMQVAMVTGDALLTAAHVAKEVAICDTNDGVVEIDMLDFEKNEELIALVKSRRALVSSGGARREKKSKKQQNERPLKPILILEQDSLGSMYWQSYDDESRVCDFVSGEVAALAAKNDLATTGKNLAAAFEFDEGTKKVLQHFKKNS